MDQSSLRPLPWLPVLETGFAEIDAQHRALIEDANAIQAQIAGRGDWDKLAAAVAKMHRDCQLHFADESRLLSGSGFSDATAHALEHERILREVADIHGIVHATTNPSPLHWELAATLRGLLIDHFLRYDLKYKSHVMYYQPFGP